MEMLHRFAFEVFPYLCLTTFVVGHGYRYATDAHGWNARSSELLDKESLRFPITIFHWGILLTLVGHTGGLLIPQRLYDAVGIDGRAHLGIAFYSGMAVGLMAVGGCALLLGRRLLRPRLQANTTAGDWLTLGLLLWVVGLGTYNVFFGHHNVLDTVAPWIRGIVTMRPQPELMRPVPFSYKLHVLSGLALLGLSPFTRLVHVWSAPIAYLFRRHLVFRRYQQAGSVPTMGLDAD